MFVFKESNRGHRKVQAQLVRGGKKALRVVNDEGTFKLVAEGKRGGVVVGPLNGFSKQYEAVQYGVEHYGKEAIRVRHAVAA